MARSKEIFALWWDNRELQTYLYKLIIVISSQSVREIGMTGYQVPAWPTPTRRRCGYVHIDNLLSHSLSFDKTGPQLRELLRKSFSHKAPVPQLVALVESLRLHANSNYEAWYVQELRRSVASLQRVEQNAQIELDADELRETISNYLQVCRDHSCAFYHAIISHICLFDLPSLTETVQVRVFHILTRVRQWPRLSPISLLQQLSRHRWTKLSIEWKGIFVAYGCSLTDLQRAERLMSHVDNHDELLKELKTPGHTNWEPFDFPESLLLEIENGILIRGVQEDIALKMRKSVSGKNYVLQLNMGEGKSSVIVPIVAASIANETCLVRVLVAKPQSRQMFHMLVSKLGGLLDRRVYQMPVSRALKLEEPEAEALERMCRDCMEQGGVLLVQPEHILSLKLKCIESFISKNTEVGSSLLCTLRFFEAYSRDIVDESDENFNVKFELVYTVGVQRPIELSPQRWVLIQQVLDILRREAPKVRQEFPRSIEVEEHRVGRVPRMRLLRPDAEKALFDRIAAHVCESGVDSLQISRQPANVRQALRRYILQPNLTAEEISAVETNNSTGFWTKASAGPLLILRGLFAGGVLGFCLGQKRWRVNYGPDPNRHPPTSLSVPY